MMISELEQIKNLRKKFGITQVQLAHMANVSQSLIAKIESGRIDPTYSNVRKIFTALNDMGKKQELKASDIMNHNIVSVSPDEDIEGAIKKMKKFNISQLPVISDHKSIGLVSEAIVLEGILNKKGRKIENIMTDSPPVVPMTTSTDAILNLLQFVPMILVSSDGKLMGVITKSDVIEKMYSK